MWFSDQEMQVIFQPRGTLLRQQGRIYQPHAGYSIPRAAAILWQGNSNYYAC
jgi:hypothetical protein